MPLRSLSLLLCLALTSPLLAETECQRSKILAFSFKAWEKEACSPEELESFASGLRLCDQGEEAKEEIAPYAKHFFSEALNEKQLSELLKLGNEGELSGLPPEKCPRIVATLVLYKARDIFNATMRTAATNKDRALCREKLEEVTREIKAFLPEKIKYCGLLSAENEDLKHQGLIKAKKDFCNFFPFGCKFL